MKQHNLLVRGIHRIWVYLVSFIAMSLAYQYGSFDMCLGNFRYGILECIAAGIVGVGLTFSLVYLGQFECRATDWIKTIGMYSYWIICIHTIEFEFIRWDLFVDAIPNKYVALGFEFLIKAIIITAACYLLKKAMQYRYQKKRHINDTKRIN